MKHDIHYYKKPACELRTLCGIFVHCVEFYHNGKMKKGHTIYTNRVTCKSCLDKLKEI